MRLVLRDLVRRPLFAATVIVTLALGIGATTAAFALIDAVFLTRLPIADQDRVVGMWATNPTYGALDQWPVPWGTHTRLVERHRAFSAVAAYRAGEPYGFAARAGDRTVHVAVTAVTGNFFETLGVRAQLGRLIRPDDDQLGGPAIVVLSDHVWRSDFGADPAVLGKTLFFAGGWHRVIGVAPAEFSYPVGTTVWTGATREIQRMFAGGTPDSVGFLLVGRMVPGVTARQAREELEAVLRTYPPANALYPRGGESIYAMPTTGVAEPYADIVLGHDLRPGVIVLFCAVALVLLIACTNVASLLIARGLTRQTELAVRSALGASRTRIAGQLLMEAVVLGIAGGLLSIALATAFVHVAVALAPADLPVIRTAHIDVRVLLFAIAITGASVLAFGLAPALQGARHDTSDALRAGSRSVTRGPIAKLARHALVAAQLALGLVILSGAGLLGRTLVHLQRIDLGFDPKHILFFHIDLLIPSQAIPVEAVLQRWNAARDRIAGRLPASGILGLTTTVAPPLDGHLETVPISVDDQPASRNSPEAHGELAFDDYFKVMRIPLISGRAFTHADDSGAVPVAIVNESFARRMWPGQDAIGHRVHWAGDLPKDRTYIVIGVSKDTRYQELAALPQPTVFFNPRQNGRSRFLVCRTHHGRSGPRGCPVGATHRSRRSRHGDRALRERPSAPRCPPGPPARFGDAAGGPLPGRTAPGRDWPLRRALGLSPGTPAGDRHPLRAGRDARPTPVPGADANARRWRRGARRRRSVGARRGPPVAPERPRRRPGRWVHPRGRRGGPSRRCRGRRLRACGPRGAGRSPDGTRCRLAGRRA